VGTELFAHARKVAAMIFRYLGVSVGSQGRKSAQSLDLDCPSLSWPYFDAGVYLIDYPDVAQAGLSAEQHYKLHGWLERRRTSPYFDPDFYAKSYLQDAGEVDPLLHYVTEGWQKGFLPNPYFFPQWYLQSNADVAEAGVEPLRHYILWGWREGRNPSPYFDVSLYLENNADVRAAGLEPLRHYMEYGFLESGRNPNAFFDTGWYRSTYAADLKGDDDPLLHYVKEGSAAGHAPGPRFDASYYLANYPEVREFGEPLAHYLEHGRFERRSPHPDAVEVRDERLEEWAKVNASSERRTALLAKALNLPSHHPNPGEAARTTFLRALDGVVCVSFDIFDTLIERRSGKPETVFALLDADARRRGFKGPDFVEARKAAEARARQIAGVREVTIAEIYDELFQASGLSIADCRALSQAECDYEVQLCEVKFVGKMLFETALSANFRIFLLSDIYLDKKVVQKILEKAEISGFEELFVSSQLGASKHYGGLYKLLLEHTRLTPDQVIHIGDNDYSDGAVPRGMGIRTLHMAKSDAMTASPTLATWFAESPATPAGCWKAIVGGELLYRESQAYGNGMSSSAARTANYIGAQILGPPLLAFAQFIARRATLMGYDALHFASRDGFYLKEAYDLLRANDPGLPCSSYFLASRRVCRAAGIATIEDIMQVADVDHYPMKVGDFLTARFLLTGEDLTALPTAAKSDLDRIVSHSRGDTKLHQTLKLCAPVILKRCIAHADAYKLYLKQAGLDRPGAAIVDIGYRGTIQRNVSDLVDGRLDGIYFITWPDVVGLLSRGLRYDAFIASDRDANDPVVRYVQLFELFFSGTHGSVQHFEMRDGGPVPVLADPNIDLNSRRTLNAMRAGALEFVRDIVDRYPSLLASPIPDGVATVGPLVEFLRNPSTLIVEGLQGHNFEDSFGGETRPLVVPPQPDLSYQEVLAKSCWREGSATLWRAARTGGRRADWSHANGAFDQFEQNRTCPATALADDALAREAAPL